MRILAATLAGFGALVVAVALGAVMGGIAGEEPAGIEVAWWVAAAGAVILLVALGVEVVRRRGLRR
ncbi:hypothetical protein [Clavibacter michiganensis]|uniref:Uncharacterized protein n=1 Tax=Clavibacter michiganensis subsp. insidiosus TaxID=33014 RepID=A0A0D5CMM1_9MICO|nr:hypothetical protein [Clavibacter michiganensis]AJW80547.1 hypothetical protein VO01_11515 [Clavibacter michiganensis subsp. insidiosus]OQJ61350.1 hypothetical protein B5P21_12715 [Clavibacter michiganensis subsp. insidiosus]RII86802.1 hypothetical protein DZF92_09260 [Clavibacter michiganensis subsp. insidiosus]RMC84811.1 hypothetical protein CmiCFBP2404_10370 [Clavibacter michiganensis subsp. insidiosus]